MKILLVFDSKYGNTQKIAQVIGEALDSPARHASELRPVDLQNCELLVIGTPTHGGFPSEAINALVKGAPALKNLPVAAFDTRTKTTIFGYAAPKVARSLEKKGARLVVAPEGFLVLGTQGPLMAGELERAADWAKKLI